MSTAMHDPTLAVPGSSDPTRRVNYVNGMILGVDDFIQEATYLLARDRWLAREALGYGTLTGLDVTVDAAGDGRWQVAVSPGVALTPSGHLVEVSRVQCALLDDWLIANRETVTAPAGGAPLSIYVVLRYAACLTDDQPVPGEPCGTQDVYVKPSRITDDFALELRLDAPDQVEEDAVRAFAAWLARIPVGAASHSDEALASFASRLRVFAVAKDPIPDGADFAPVEDWGTEPPPADLSIPTAHVTEYLRVAFRVWATQFRPAMRTGAPPTGIAGPDEENVLLARLAVGLKAATDTAGNRVQVADPAVEPVVDASTRPLLAHLRMVEEWLLYQLRQAEGPEPPPAIEYGSAATSETAFGQTASAGSSDQVARADHTHGTPPDPIPAHKRDTSAHTLAGDVTGPVGKTQVVALQGRGVASTVPGDGQVLTFRNGTWQPAAVPVPPSRPVTGPFVEHATDRPYRIVAAGTIQFDVPNDRLFVVGHNDTLYNNLLPVGIDAAERTVTVVFDGYGPPDLKDADGHRYIVKALPWFEFRDAEREEEEGEEGGDAEVGFFAVGVRRFTEEGIALAVVAPDNNDQVRGRIMIEISEYQSIAPR